MRLAAIDIGTNTTRLIVAESTLGGGYRDLQRRLIFTRLGEGVDRERKIRPEAIRRTLDALAEYCALCGEMEVATIRVVGTSALRDAENSEEFVKLARKLTGTQPEILSGEDEARLSLLGATDGMERDLYLVCDIGGGSTEFVLGGKSDSRRRDTPGSEAAEGRRSGPRGVALLRSVSLDIGSVRMTERFLASDPPAAEEMILMEEAIDSAMEEAVERVGEVSAARLVGVAGTITTLAALHLGLDTYDPERTHHLRMERAHIERLYKMLASLSFDERRAISAMPEGRADVIVAGAAILVRGMRAFGITDITVSERDILDGLVIDMIKD